MDTTTTSPRRARFVPSVMGDDPDPVAKPPPWHQTITGRLRPPPLTGPTAGVQTLSTRQSSPSTGRLFPETESASADPRGTVGSLCGALCPYSSASRTPVHRAGSAGAMKRFAPVVLAPYGTPLKVMIPLLSTPRIFP